MAKKTPYERLVHYLVRQKKINMNVCLPLIVQYGDWRASESGGTGDGAAEILDKIGLEQAPIYHEKYFYEAYYKDEDYNFGYDYMSKYRPSPSGCSAFVKDGFLTRNYDFNYDARPEVVIHMAANDKGRHASVGMAAAAAQLTDESMYKAAARQWIDEEDIEAYKLIPFLTLDGINDAGFSCEINITGVGDCGKTTGTNPGAEITLCGLMLVRYLLDYADSVDSAIDIVKNKLNIFNCYYGDAFQEEFHFMIADKDKHAVIEFINNEVVVIESDYLTNYHLYLEKQLEEGAITEAEFNDHHLMGIERAELIKKAFEDYERNGFFGYYGDLNDRQMEMLWFAVYRLDCCKAYLPETSPFWYSDYETGDIKHNTPIETVQEIADRAAELYKNRERDGALWQTVHSVSYDLNKLSESREADPTVMCVIPQASEQVNRQIKTVYKFSIGGKDEEMKENWNGGLIME